MGLLDAFYTQGSAPPNPDATFPQLLSSPMGQGLLGAVAGWAANARRGAPVNSIGRGLLGGLAAYGNAGQEDLKRKYMTAQMDDMAQQQALRAAQVAQLGRKQSLLEELFPKNGASQPAMPGQLGSGSFGAVSPPQGQPDIPPVMSPGQSIGARLNPDMLARLKAGADIDLTDIYKLTQPDMQVNNGYAYDKRTLRPGFLPQTSVSQNGQATVMTVGEDGMPRVSTPPGALESYSAFRAADEAAKAGSDVVKVYNPTTQREELVPRSQVLRAAQPAPRAPAPTQGVSAQPGMRGNFIGSPDAVMASIQDIRDPQERANAMAAFQEQANRTPGFAKGSAFAAGPSSGETNAAAADKTYQEQVAKSVSEKRNQIMEAGLQAPNKVAKLNYLNQLLADVDGGKLTPTGTNIASALNSVGIKVDPNLPNKEAAAALANELALELRNPGGGAGMPGALSNSDRDFLASMTPNMGQSLKGRQALVQAKTSLAQREQQVATFARNYENKYGKLDNRFFEQLQAWSEANPLFGRK